MSTPFDRRSASSMRRSASYAQFMDRLVKSQANPMTPPSSPKSVKHGGDRKRPHGSSNAFVAKTPAPIRLPFDLGPGARAVVDMALRSARERIDDTNVAVIRARVTRDQLKLSGVSPDAFVQIALQLAFFRDQGHFTLTYEASMTRMFAEGRTETVRSVTSESCAFVRAVESGRASREELMRSLQVACAAHRRNYIESLSGNGVDRHLFALYIASRTMRPDEEPPTLLKHALGQQFRLSTSQQPQIQAPEVRRLVPDALKNFAVSPGGGFGPVTDDGYGVSYMFVDLRSAIFFHVSSKRRSTKTDSNRFCDHIKGSIQSLKKVLGID